ncbi:cytochrome c oxidase subunit 2A [Marinicrinis lubricantis]|uniref:Cytochrome c oxidase subunit 2A n=1 Tax=Marinicrinis lubricantis TaxID=2086470 RepID=A0ABW1IUL7_9BACL
MTELKTERDRQSQAAMEPKKQIETEEPSLKGTFVSVMLLGGFLILSWVLVFMLFIARNG